MTINLSQCTFCSRRCRSLLAHIYSKKRRVEYVTWGPLEYTPTPLRHCIRVYEILFFDLHQSHFIIHKLYLHRARVCLSSMLKTQCIHLIYGKAYSEKCKRSCLFHKAFRAIDWHHSNFRVAREKRISKICHFKRSGSINDNATKQKNRFFLCIAQMIILHFSMNLIFVQSPRRTVI